MIHTFDDSPKRCDVCAGRGGTQHEARQAPNPFAYGAGDAPFIFEPAYFEKCATCNGSGRIRLQLHQIPA